MTTPFGKRGFFHLEWSEGQGREKVLITAYNCPRISKEFLAEERRTLGEWWFKQEYLCEFVDTIDQVFAHDLVMKAVSHDVQPLFPDLIKQTNVSDHHVTLLFGGTQWRRRKSYCKARSSRSRRLCRTRPR